MTVFHIPEKDRNAVIARLALFLAQCLPGKRIEVTVDRYVKRRSSSQNSYLWAACYPTILREGGEDFAGWTPDDLHEFMLGDWGGWEVIEFEGYQRQRPIRRSSKLSTVDFMAFVAHIQQFAATRGIYIADPGEVAA